MDTHRVNPRTYDTETFVFNYDTVKDTLSVRLKNHDVIRPTFKDPHRFWIGENGMIVGVEIGKLFENTQLPCATHVHMVGQAFTPWFRENTDCRVELERGIERFFALHAYELLDKGPDQFKFALEHNADVLGKIGERLPDLFEKRRALKTQLAENYQDKGVHTARGSTIFNTRVKTWVIWETAIKNPDKPEYLWSVAHLSASFGAETGHAEFCDSGVRDDGFRANHECVAYVMEKQKKIYGISPLDLDREDLRVQQMEGIVKQIELILDIHPDISLISKFDGERATVEP